MRYHDSETLTDLERLSPIDEGPLDHITDGHSRAARGISGTSTDRVCTKDYQGPTLRDSGKSVCRVRTGIGVPRLFRPQLGRLGRMSGRSGMAAGQGLYLVDYRCGMRFTQRRRI